MTEITAVRHFRDKTTDNAPCGMVRKRGVLSSKNEKLVTCAECLEKMSIKQAAARMQGTPTKPLSDDDWGSSVPPPPPPLVRNGNGATPSATPHATNGTAHLRRVEAEAEFLRAVIREAWSILDGPGDGVQAARDLMRRAPGVISPNM